MTLGQRIKQARLDMGLSQRQLCGEEITRNMLSQIENGSAKPSMTTLAYLARQLGKPVSYFLEEDAVLSPNQRIMAQARGDFAARAYREALEKLESYRLPDEVFDNERRLLETLCLLRLAEKALDQGKNVYALSLLNKAEKTGGNTPYYTPAVERERILLMYRAQPERAEELVGLLPEDDRELLLRGQALMQSGEYSRAGEVLEAAACKDAQWHYLRGQVAVAGEDYPLAVRHLREAETEYPADCAKLLEQCYRELEDYKMAYYYACKQRQG